MINKGLLSLCIITKNDEKYIFDCIDDLKDIVDEVIVADIGSTDKTIQRAKKAGATVYKVDFKDDYSKVKNFCLEHANGRWVLFLQANEIIKQEDKCEISKLLDNPNVEEYMFFIDYNSQQFTSFSPVQSLRLVRNREKYRYKYKSFEKIPDEILINIEDADIHITYRNDAVSSWEFTSRISLLEKELKKNPNDSYLLYMYGIILLNQNKFEESVLYFQKSRKNINIGYFFAPHLYKYLSLALLFTQRYNDSMQILDEAIDSFPYYRDLFVLRGELNKELKQYDNALSDFKNAVNMKERARYVLPCPDITMNVILELLADIYEEIFNYNKATECYQKALELDDGNVAFLDKICELCQITNDFRPIYQLTNNFKEEENYEKLMILSSILYKYNEYDKVLEQMDYLEKHLGKKDKIKSFKIACHVMLGDNKEDFSIINEQSPSYNDILFLQIEHSWYYNNWVNARQLIEKMNEVENVDKSKKILYVLINRLFTRKEVVNKVLNDKEYEIVNTLYKNILWLGQEEKAMLLLPLLLNVEEDDNYIKIALPWAKRNNITIIKSILNCISDEDRQHRYKINIIEQLLRCEYIETANELMSLWNLPLTKEWESVIYSKGLITKVIKYINKLKSIQISNKNTQKDFSTKTKIKPDKAVLNFYYSLGFSDKNDEELTNEKIHHNIGIYYEKRGKLQEALSGYFRTLQWQPTNKKIQNKIAKIYNENPNFFNKFLKEKMWVKEGKFFLNNEDFTNYIIGTIKYKNKKFDEAISFFSKIKHTKNIYNIVNAYILSGLCISEKVNEIEFEKYNITNELIDLFFNICKSYILSELSTNIKQYPNSEIIKIEEKRIRNSYN